MKGAHFILLLMLLLCAQVICAQNTQTPFQRIVDYPAHLTERLNQKTEKLETQLIKQTEKYLQKLARKEAKLKKKLMKTDSTIAKQLFDSSEIQYARLSKNLKNAGASAGRTSGTYLPNVDSLKTSLTFLEQNGSLVSSQQASKVSASLQQVRQLEGKLQQADVAKAFIQQRKQQINEVLGKYTNLPGSITKTYKDFNKELFYYSRQVQEYKDMLNDPDKMVTKALSLLNKLPAFQSFMQQHSELAGLFAVPSGSGNNIDLAGLQTRNDVQQLIQRQFASGGPNVNQILQQNLQAAQAQIGQLKDKINKLGGSESDMDIPDFKPNNQKTKSFWKRLEYGTNLQTQKSASYFPTTSDIGMSVGYKLSDKSIVGIGGSYKIGWGKDIRNFDISSQGAGLRSFLDVKLKGSFFASGGFEYNYQPLSYTQSLTPDEKKQGEAWQQSGLVGVSKIISLKSKTFKKTKVQVLWDILSYQQIPKAQAIKFRVGYNL